MVGEYDAGHDYDKFEDYHDEVEIEFDDIKDEDSYYDNGEESDENEKDDSGMINYE